MNVLPFRLGTRQSGPLSSFIFGIHYIASLNKFHKGREINSIKTGKKFLFIDDIIIYIKYIMEFSKHVLQIMRLIML